MTETTCHAEVLVAILRKYMAAPALIATAAPLGELDIDLFDLPVICLDIEDAFDITIRCDDDIDGTTTVEMLIGCVVSRIALKASRPRTSVPRPSQGGWMTTGAERRR